MQETQVDPWVGKMPWRGKWQPLQYSCLENSMGRGACRAVDHGVTELDTTEQHMHTEKRERDFFRKIISPQSILARIQG